MVRAIASLVVLTVFAGVGSACPWWGRCCRPAPVVVYPYCPPPGPVVVYPYSPPQGPVAVSPAPVTPSAPESPAPAPEPPPAPADKVLEPAEVYEQCVRSCVFIVTPIKGGHVEGAGALIDAEKRLVITTLRTVDESGYVFVQFPVRNKDGSLMTDKKKYIERIPAGQAIKGKVLFRDKTRDLALVQLDKLPPDTPAIPLAKKSVRVGETVVNIGHPGQLNSTFSTTEGRVRAVGVEDAQAGGPGEVVRIKAKMVTANNPVPPGDTGGPLIDKYGYLVAVTASELSAGNVSRFIDVTEVRAFLAEKRVTIQELVSVVPPLAKPGDIISGPDGEVRKPDPSRNAPSTPDLLHRGDTPAEDERLAAQALQRARLFAEGDDNRPTYMAKLKQVVSKYPGTAAAKEAKKILDTLK
jgi:S1-C subfamily serine protease